LLNGTACVPRPASPLKNQMRPMVFRGREAIELVSCTKLHKIAQKRGSEQRTRAKGRVETCGNMAADERR
jgi:hypothetical protein